MADILEAEFYCNAFQKKVRLKTILNCLLEILRSKSVALKRDSDIVFIVMFPRQEILGNYPSSKIHIFQGNTGSSNECLN